MANWVSEHKSISIGGGLTVLMTFAQIFSDKVKAHPHWAACVFAVGLLMVLVPLLTPFFGKSSSLAPTNSNSVGGDNTGNQIIAHNSTIHLNGDVSRQQVNMPPPAPTQPPRLSPSLELAAEFHMNLSYLEEHGDWSVNPYGGKFSIVVWVANPVPPVGSLSSQVHSLVAHVKLSCGGGIHRTISRAYWLNRSQNETTLNIGERAALVVAVLEGSTWAMYQNPHSVSPFGTPLPPVICPVGQRFTVPDINPVIAEVSIIATDQGLTLAQKRFEITHQGNTYEGVTYSKRELT